MRAVRVLDDEGRRGGLGATDIAAIVGVDRYTRPIGVYLEKTGTPVPRVQSWRMRMGQILEDAIADAYSEQTGRRLARVSTVFHSLYPFLYAHPDRRVIGEPGLVEIKTTRRSDLYEGERVPPDVKVQVCWQLHLTRRQWCDVVPLGPTLEIEPRRVAYDPELAALLETEAVRFWHEHVLAGVPPPVDGSDEYRAWLKSLHPIEEEASERQATPEEDLLIEEIGVLRKRAKDVDEHKALLENRLIAAMGDVARLTSPVANVTYKTTAGSTYTVTREPGRVLRIHFPKGD